MSNDITITFAVPGKSADEVRAFVADALARDLVLRGRTLGAPGVPEGAGSWAHLVAGFAGITVKDANALVPFIRVMASQARHDAPKAAKAPAKAPAKGGRKPKAASMAKAAADVPAPGMDTVLAALASITARLDAMDD
jgi:hypothetical protein